MTYPLTPVSCAVSIQGETVADGSVDTELPTALSGLRVVWGRSTTVDQPDTGTAAFTIEDRSGDQTFARLAAVGRIVQITATGTTWSDDTAGTYLDPGFEVAPIGPAGRRARGDGNLTPAVESDGIGRRLRSTLRAGATSTAGGVYVPPTATADPSDPTAWDAIPVAQPGQRWSVEVGTITRSPGARLFAYAAEYATPWDTAPIRTALDPIPDDATAYAAEYTPTSPGRWQGVYVAANPSGYSWSTIPAGSWSALDPAYTWESAAGFTLDDLDITHPAEGLARSVLVFDGRITDAEARWDESTGACLVEVTAADFTADLANRDVGAEPWAAEPLSSRAARIVAASGLPGLIAYVDPRPGALVVSRIDVDRQPVHGMMADLATTADAVLWAAAHSTTGPYLWVEDIHARQSARVLVEVGGIVEIGPATTGAVALSACDLDLDPVRWIQSNADLATRAVVSWRDQSGDPDPIDRDEQVTYPDAEDPAGPYGVRRVQVTTQLTSAADAVQIASGLVARLFASAMWRVAGLTYHVYPDADAAAVDTALTLLDGTARIGAPVLISDLPPWSPLPGPTTTGYLEGGAYSYVDGSWVFELVMSAAAGLGSSVVWQELDPSWDWLDFDPAIAWLDLIGVGADTGGTRP